MERVTTAASAGGSDEVCGIHRRGTVGDGLGLWVSVQFVGGRQQLGWAWRATLAQPVTDSQNNRRFMGLGRKYVQIRPSSDAMIC
jgi:hypothetical protein